MYEAGGRVARTCSYPAASSCAGTTTLIDPTGHTAEGCGTDVTNAECTAISNANQVKARKKEQAQRARVAATGNRACAATGDCAGPSRVYVSPKPVAPVVVGPPPAVASPGDPWEVTATGGCIGISGGLGAYVALQFCGLRTSSGQQGVTVSLDTGGMAGGGASISAGPVWSTSTDLHQLSGGGGTFGGSIVDGAGGGVEVSVTRSDEKPVYTYSAFAAVGIKNGPLVAEIHAGGGPTGVLTVDDVVAWLHAQGWFN